MPPKKNPAKAGKEKKKEGITPKDVEGASIEELNQKIATLEKEKNKEEEYRNYMQLERDKINAFWEITKKELDDKKAELRNKDREMEEMEERHQVEIKVYKQKVKHLLYEHQNNITTLKADGELALKLQQDDFRKRESELVRDKRSLRQDSKEQELAHQDVIRQLKLEHAKEITKLRQEFELQAKELQQKYEKKMKILRDDLELRRKQVETLRQHLANYEKDKLSLAQTKTRLMNAEKQIKNLEWENEVLQQRFGKVQQERDELYSKFEASIYDVQQKTGLKSLLLAKKLEAIGEQLEMKEAQLAEVLAAAHMDPSTLQQVNKKLEEVLDNKNSVIKALQYDISKVSKAHNDLIRVYEAKLAEFGIPVDELGFRPLVTNTSTGPAGLVVGA